LEKATREKGTGSGPGVGSDTETVAGCPGACPPFASRESNARSHTERRGFCVWSAKGGGEPVAVVEKGGTTVQDMAGLFSAGQTGMSAPPLQQSRHVVQRRRRRFTSSSRATDLFRVGPDIFRWGRHSCLPPVRLRLKRAETASRPASIPVCFDTHFRYALMGLDGIRDSRGYHANRDNRGGHIRSRPLSPRTALWQRSAAKAQGYCCNTFVNWQSPSG